MEKFEVKIIQSGPIVTVQVYDKDLNVEVGIGEKLEDAIAQVVSKVCLKKLYDPKNGKALELLKEFSKTADADILFEKTLKLLE